MKKVLFTVCIGSPLVPAGYQLRAYAEVYGFNALKHLRPACWVGGLITIDENHEFQLVLDKRWLQVAGGMRRLVRVA